MNSPEQLAPLPTTAAGEAPLAGGPAALPQQIGRYRILGLLGTGGMGEVYRAFDPHLDRQVALKQPHFDGPAAEVQRRVERFQSEARAAAQILHPHVCPIFDVGEEEGRPFVVMALVEGQSLAQHLEAHSGPLDVGTAVTLARQVLDGLAAVHARGIVHRDIKPANILLDAAGRPFLTDFGLARPETPNGPFTSEGVIVGTPCYMAPEQAAGRSEQVGPWTDLFAVGVVLYELLTGIRPFQARGPAVLAQILRDEPPPPRGLRPGLDAGLEAVVLRALHKDPRQRFPDAGAFAQALLPWAASATAPGTIAAAPAPIDTSPAILREDHTRLPRRGYPVARIGGWLAGGVLITAGMGVLALAALAAVQGALGWVPIPFFAILAGFLILVGIFGVWHTTEKRYSPEGLLRSADFGNAELARRALANGVPPDSRDDMDETALMHAAARGHTAIVKLLLVRGANPALRNHFGQTAQDIALASGRSEVVALLSGAAVPSAVAGADLPRFAPRTGLVVAALAGGLATSVVLWWLDPGPEVITPEVYVTLRQQRLVKRLTSFADGEEDRWLEGELKTLDSPVVRELGLTKRTFLVSRNDPQWRVLQADKLPDDGVATAIHVGDMVRPVRAPRWWQALLMLAVPLAVAVFIGRVLSPVRLLIGKD